MRIAFSTEDRTHIKMTLEQAKDARADLLVFGELWLNQPGGIESDHELIVKIGKSAGAAGMPIIFGYCELCKTGTYSAAQFIDADGHSISNCRSTHPRNGDLTANNWMTIVDVDDERIGILLDQDYLLPEPARALALSGATTFLKLSKHPSEDVLIEQAILTSRAAENGVAALSISERDVLGFSPTGKKLQPVSCTERMTVFDIEGDRPNMPIRRPELYQKLVSVDA